MVVIIPPRFRDLTHIGDGIEQIGIQNIFAIGAIEPFDVGILSGAAGFNESPENVMQFSTIGVIPYWVAI